MGIIWLEETDPYKNLALETICFKNRLGPEVLLWQNQASVFIGRNQSPWHELELQALYEDKIPLLRRFSGGGAVFHDLGNLNLSFLDGANKSAHFEALLKTFSRFDIPVVVGERGELTVQGYKISGSAYYFYQGRMLHHLTLLFDADLEKLWRYLKRQGDNHETRAVASVRQSVANLTELYPQLTMNDFAEAFGRQWSTPSAIRTNVGAVRTNVDALRINGLSLIGARAEHERAYIETISQLKSWQWAYGTSPEFVAKVALLGYPLQLQIKDGLVTGIEGALPETMQHFVDQRLYSPYIEEQWR